MAISYVGAGTRSLVANAATTPGVPAGVATGDLLIIFDTISSGGTAPVPGTPAGWTQKSTYFNDGPTYRVRLTWYYRAYAPGVTAPTITYSGTSGDEHSSRMFAFRGAAVVGDPTDVLGTPALLTTSSTTAGPIPGVTTSSTGGMVLVGVVRDNDLSDGSSGWQPLTGDSLTWVEIEEYGSVSGADKSSFALDYAIVPTAPKTITNKTFTISGSSVSGRGIGQMWAIKAQETLVPISDSATGSDLLDVDKTQKRTVVETATGVDAGTVFSVSDAVTDSATSSESITVDVLEPKSTTDSGTGTDSVSTSLFLDHQLTETGTGVDTATPVRTTFVAPTDTGSGTDAATLLQLRAYTESGTGTDSIQGVVRRTTLEEQGTGTEAIAIVEIPFTQVLAPRIQTIYELVVIARVPNVSGAPALMEIDPIEWKSISYSDTLSAPQELTATCQISSLTEPVLQRLRAPHELATELWLYRDGKVVFAGPLVGWQTSGETLTVRCLGLLAYLRLMGINSDLRYVNNDQASVVAHMVNSWQVLEYGHFGIDTSAAGLNGVGVTVTYMRDELKNVGAEIETMSKSAQGFDVEVDPTSRQLRIWTPTKGVDRSSGEDAIVIDSRNITSSDVMCSVALGDLASDAYGTGTASGTDTTLFAAYYNAETRARYGRSLVSQAFSDVSTQDALNNFVIGLLQARGQALLIPGPKVRVTPDADLRNFTVGDTVSYELGGSLGVSGAFRIRKMTVSVTSTGSEAVDLEFV